jgi:hypothetical protein
MSVLDPLQISFYLWPSGCSVFSPLSMDRELLLQEVRNLPWTSSFYTPFVGRINKVRLEMQPQIKTLPIPWT